MTRATTDLVSASGSNGLTGRREHEQADIHVTPGFRPALSRRPAGEQTRGQMMNEMRMTYLIQAWYLQHRRRQHQHLTETNVQHAAPDARTLIRNTPWMTSVGSGVTTKTRKQENAMQKDGGHRDHEYHDHHEQNKELRLMSAVSQIGPVGTLATHAVRCCRPTTAW